MKVTLDLARLLGEGAITPDEYAKLSRLGRADTGSLAFNILIGVGITAVGASAVALVPTPVTGVVIGAAVAAFGLLLLLRARSWLVLANICLAVGALLFGGGVLLLGQGSLLAFLAVAATFLVTAVLAQSGLLVTLGTLAVAGAVGAGTGYSHAGYELSIQQPALTVIVFSAVALGAWHAAKVVGHAYARLAIIAARTALFLVNFGFWVGSLWGDTLDWLRAGAAGSDAAARAFVPPAAFALAWAAALVAVGFWAVRADRRWVVNLVAVFGCIHLYTQWFERLDATPLSVLMAGVSTLAIAVGLWKWNQGRGAPPLAAAAG